MTRTNKNFGERLLRPHVLSTFSPFTIPPFERFSEKEGASADRQRAGTAALEESQTTARAKSAADFARTHRPDSHSPVNCSLDMRGAGPSVRQLFAREPVHKRKACRQLSGREESRLQ